MATPVQESPRPVCSHHQRRCLVRFPFCGKFFPCYCCHNESDCTEDQARAANATHIRCTICYNEQVVRFYLRTEFKFSSLSFLRYTATKFLQTQSNRHVKRNAVNWLSKWFSLSYWYDILNAFQIDENSQRCGSCNSKMSEYFCATYVCWQEPSPLHEVWDLQVRCYAPCSFIIEYVSINYEFSLETVRHVLHSLKHSLKK